MNAEPLLFVPRDLQPREQLERILSAISAGFVKNPIEKTDAVIREGLALIGQTTTSDRAYLFLFRSDGTIVDNTHEWCAEGIQAQIENLQGIDLHKQLPWFSQQIRSATVFHVPDTTAMEPAACREQEHFRAQDIQALIVVPMRIDGALVGFVGFDAVTKKRSWSDFEQDVLSRTSEIFARALEKKQANALLSESRAQLRMALEGTRAGLWDWHIPTGQVIFNDRWAEIIGYTLAELEPLSIQTWIDHCHPDDLKKSNKLLEKHFARQLDYYDCTCRMKHKGGHWVWVRDCGRVSEWSEDGRPVRMAGTHVDITEFKSAQGALADSEARLRLIFENLPDCIIQLDRDLKILWANRAAFSLAPDALGKTCCSAFTGASAPCAGCPALKCLASGNMETAELQHARFAGVWGESWWSCIGVPLKNGQGLVIGAIKIGRNITDQVHLESSLRTAHTMNSVGMLASGIAHEFNNILGGIMGYAEIAQDYVPAGSPGRMSLDEILKLSIRARDLVRQLLAFSRKSISSKHLYQPHAVLQEQLARLRNRVPANIEVRTLLDERTGPVMANAAELEQIGLNLCTNAVDAMRDKGGVLEITLSPVILDAEVAKAFQDIPPGEYVRLTVSDTGCGIDPTIIDRIFDPFFTTKDVGQGTGLGLAVVHGLVKIHGGAVAVASIPGQGSTFTVVIPTARIGAADKD